MGTVSAQRAPGRLYPSATIALIVIKLRYAVKLCGPVMLYNDGDNQGTASHEDRRGMTDTRRQGIAIAIPAKNEQDHILGCVDAIDRAAACIDGIVTIVVLANDCTDRTVALLDQWEGRHAVLAWSSVSLLPGAQHAGWARRLALDAAAAVLSDDRDLLLSTDADTNVAPDWISRTIAHIAAGNDAVAGRALTTRLDRAALGRSARRRLDQLGRYYTALDYLRAAGCLHAAGEPTDHDAWPRHFYEGGASIALSLELYRRIGGAPTPPVAEDRALFDRIRDHGGRIRHPLDVRVFTSCRTAGRAPGGMADAVARWIDQPETAPLHETYAIAAALNPACATPQDQLTFATLPNAIAEAQALIRTFLDVARPSITLHRVDPPQIEPIRLVPVAAHDGQPIAEGGTEFCDRVVPAFGIIGFADPVDQHHMACRRDRRTQISR